MTPTQRALADCKRLGLPAAIVEKWVAQVRQRKDVWGFGDLLVLDGKPGALLAQVTTRSNAAARVEKICGPCKAAALAWVKAGNRVEVWDYATNMVGKRRRYTRRVTDITVEMLNMEEGDHDERNAAARAAPSDPAAPR